MCTADKNMLELIKVLKTNHEIKFDMDFCRAIGLRKQNLVNIRKGNAHFTTDHIEMAIKVFGADANWIFGVSDSVFLSNKKRHREEKETFINNDTV